MRFWLFFCEQVGHWADLPRWHALALLSVAGLGRCRVRAAPDTGVCDHISYIRMNASLGSSSPSSVPLQLWQNHVFASPFVCLEQRTLGPVVAQVRVLQSPCNAARGGGRARRRRRRRPPPEAIFFRDLSIFQRFSLKITPVRG